MECRALCLKSNTVEEFKEEEEEEEKVIKMYKIELHV